MGKSLLIFIIPKSNRDFADGHICRPDLNIVIITHGLTLRLVRREGGGREGWKEGVIYAYESRICLLTYLP